MGVAEDDGEVTASQQTATADTGGKSWWWTSEERVFEEAFSIVEQKIRLIYIDKGQVCAQTESRSVGQSFSLEVQDLDVEMIEDLSNRR